MTEALANGPRTREEIVQIGMVLVPPGVAWRKAQRNIWFERAKHSHTSKTRGKPREERGPGDPRTIATGKRRVVQQNIQRAVKTGRFVLTERDGVQYLALGRRDGDHLQHP